MSDTIVNVANTADINEGEVRSFRVDEIDVAVCNVGGSFYAIENVCTHDNGPLGEGSLKGCEIECPRHGARFDVTNGAVTRQPAYGPVPTFPVTVDNGEIYIDISNY